MAHGKSPQSSGALCCAPIASGQWHLPTSQRQSHGSATDTNPEALTTQNSTEKNGGLPCCSLPSCAVSACIRERKHDGHLRKCHFVMNKCVSFLSRSGREPSPSRYDYCLFCQRLTILIPLLMCSTTPSYLKPFCQKQSPGRAKYREIPRCT